MYAYIWEYEVRPEADDRFREIYGADGAWVALFRQAPGYVSTRLYRDRHAPHFYVTVDTWTSREAHQSFRQQFAGPLLELDTVCEALTEREVLLGEFDLVEG
jgi:heme-degrading monooxygenase HmoA